VAFGPDGSLATLSRDRSARVWRLAAPPEQAVLSHPFPLRSGAFSPDGKLILTIAGKEARLWRASDGGLACGPLPCQGDVNDCAFAADGGFFTATDNGQARRWSAADGGFFTATEYSHADGRGIVSLAVCPGGRLLATCGMDGRAVLWQVEGKKGLELKHDGVVYVAAFSPDGRRLLTGEHNGLTRTWDEHGRLICTFRHARRTAAPVRNVLFSRDGRRAFAAGEDNWARAWDVDRPDEPAFEMPHGHFVHGLALSPDGGRLATASHDATVRVWDAAEGKPLTPPMRHRRAAHHVAFHPAGLLLVSAGADAARLWHAALGKPIGPPLTHGGKVMIASFDPAGGRLLTCGADATARLWPVPRPMPGDAEAIIRWTERLTGKTLDAGGGVRLLEAAEWRERAGGPR
jgi:WD40 repeat protein